MRRKALTLVLLVAAAALFVAASGEVLSHPYLHTVGAPPPGLGGETLSIRTRHGDSIAGWWGPGLPGAGAVLLLHGVHADRRVMTGRAEFLSRLGYSVLLIDLPAHGESVAAHITYGLGEAEGVTAALQYIAARVPQEKVGVIAISLGAAALVLSKPNPVPVAVVLESMFPTIDDAVSNRLGAYLGDWSRPFAPLLLAQMPLRLNVGADQLRPIADLPSLKAPTLIAAGAIDRFTTRAETLRIFDAAPGPKELWIVDGAARDDLYAFDPATYEAKVSDFLGRRLRAVPSPASDLRLPAIDK